MNHTKKEPRKKGTNSQKIKKKQKRNQTKKEPSKKGITQKTGKKGIMPKRNHAEKDLYKKK